MKKRRVIKRRASKRRIITPRELKELNRELATLRSIAGGDDEVLILGLLPVIIAALPGVIAGFKAIIDGIRQAKETPAEAKAHLEQISVDLGAMVRRVAMTPLPGD